MTDTAREIANRRQMAASDPAVSAFVAASAGSGKTKLLTDRLLRLMLSGADPARIQCLTFTKAAAAEMAVRLQGTLGQWVTLPDPALDVALSGLAIAPGDATRANARALFARVLDLPGGMRIGTIHAFCQSLLRRFPLEARLSPHFRLVEQIDADLALHEAREDMLARADDVSQRTQLGLLAGLATADGFGKLVDLLKRDRARLDHAHALGVNGFAATLGKFLGAATGDDATVLRRAVTWDGAVALRAALQQIASAGSKGVAANATERLDWLALTPAARADRWADWRHVYLFDTNQPRGLGKLINANLANARPDLADALRAEQARIAAVEDSRNAARIVAITAALTDLAGPVVTAYEARKDSAAWLDYDDLIARSSRLLVDPGAAWVLYKLDGGLDHLLLDEVQDTSPQQWAIAGALTAEFFAGAGARDLPRTVFAVGDRKQSIFSFQGADPDAFEHWRKRLGSSVTAAAGTWRDVSLDVSFRSTAPVLALVDAVFANPSAAAGVLTSGPALHHVADRAGHAGCVELWPLTPRPDVAAPAGWQQPDSNLGTRSADQRLAETLAQWIAAQTGGNVMLESRGRTLAPGDVLVLVRRRNDFARALVRALKDRKVPVAGLDRMMLTEQPAVADLLALADTLLLPQDDLSLACVLTSPLGGLGDPSLMDLAAGRTGRLWDTLRERAGERPDWQAADAFIARLLTRVDYATPHALLAEALGPLGGRARLLARLGPEAAEPIDELLNAALSHAQTHPPSLQGFLQWLRQSGAEVKRQAEGAGGLVRIMTVHGAKGLQAPLVILPDTTTVPQDDGPLMWTQGADGDARLPVWVPLRDMHCMASDRLRVDAARRGLDEHNRLLYVALTRAEDRLVVCGTQTRNTVPAASWYSLIAEGFTALGATATPFDAVAQPWPGDLLRHAAAQTQPADRVAFHERAAPPAALPAWAGHAPQWRPTAVPPEPALPTPLAPSRPADASLGSVPQAASPLAERDTGGARFRRGQLVHALLQHLPSLPPADRAAASMRYLQRQHSGLIADAAESVRADVLAVLDHAALAPLFGPAGRAEVPLTGVIAGRVVGGLVDRLAVLADRVLIADYKTNRAPPATLEAVPLLYLRQMAAYRAVLQAIHPDRPVSCILVWTTGARVMELPAAVLDRHAPGAGIAA